MKLTLPDFANSIFVVCLVDFITVSTGYYQITVYPAYLSQGGRTHFETDRWDGHNGLDSSNLIDDCRRIGTESGRWLNRDLNSNTFKNTPQDPHHHGYPDPNHFKDPNFVRNICAKYKSNLNGYGQNLDMVMELKELYWPSWMDTSHHGGRFPNNLDAAAEFVVLLLQSIKQCTNGNVPPYFEVFNEPDAAWKYVDWDTIIEYHRVVGKKLKSKFPGIKVGGACQNGVVNSADRNNYKVFNMSARFLDMSLDNLDFFSFHPYNYLRAQNGGSSYHFEGINEARLVAYMDMIENYAHQKRGKSVPLFLTEYGLSQVTGVDQDKENPFIDWAYVYQHNAHMFTYLGFRDIIDRAIGFLLANSEIQGIHSLHHSLFNHDGTPRHGAKAFQFWKHLNYHHQFVRVDSQFNNAERKISSHALVNPDNGDLLVLLHNYDKSQASVKINFLHNWLSISSASSTCMYLDSHKNPVLAEYVTVHITNNMISMRPESSCLFVFHTNKNLYNHLATVHETTYYGHDIRINIHQSCAVCILACGGCHYVAQTTITIPSLGHVQYARLRIGVSLHGSSGGHPKPKSIAVNKHSVSSYFQLYEPGRGYESTRWEVFVYNVPVTQIKQGSNEVKVEFDQDGGSVSSMAFVIGRN